jgi:hypothetical protein
VQLRPPYLVSFVNGVRARRVGVGHFDAFAIYEDATAFMKIKIEPNHPSMMGNNLVFVPNLYP